ncbi:restriction endonuclease subunit S [Halomonas sp. H10-9-1]|uniref:restriction endonuclease subunit S n=1 Tax=Halomonas sp. H10-9-1 TaxID=2950871 RepID=UPI0032DFFE0A
MARQTRPLREVKSGFTPFQEGDVLFAKITPCMENGKGAHAFGLESGVGYGSTEFHVLRAKAGNSPRYIFHLSQSSSLRLKAEASMIGSAGQKRVPSDFFRKHRVFAPDSAEQRLIAGILDTLDTQIQKTEALIAKLEKVKEGLLQDLLTRGIDKNGRLRPSPGQAPELYKESPLGLIPREWEVKRLEGLLDGIDAGWSPSCSDVAPKEGEWGVLKVSAISTGSYLPHKSKTLPERLSPIEEIEVKSGDVICVRANGVADLVGKVAYVSSTPRRLMLSDKTLRLRPGKNLDSRFLFLLMGSASSRRQIASLISGSSGQKNLSQSQINSMRVKAPSIDEQRRISGALSSITSRIEHEKSACNNAATLKSGLMDDLLTGRVRVTPLLERTQATTPA